MKDGLRERRLGGAEEEEESQLWLAETWSEVDNDDDDARQMPDNMVIMRVNDPVKPPLKVF